MDGNYVVFDSRRLLTVRAIEFVEHRTIFSIGVADFGLGSTQHPRMMLVKLMKNVGQLFAITLGYRICRVNYFLLSRITLFRVAVRCAKTEIQAPLILI